MISGTFCVVSISSEPLLLWVVPDVFTAARKRLLGIEEIKFEVVSHLGVIVDYFSLLLVPSALRVPLSLSSRRRSLHDVQGTRCLLTFVITRLLAGAPFRNIFTEDNIYMALIIINIISNLYITSIIRLFLSYILFIFLYY